MATQPKTTTGKRKQAPAFNAFTASYKNRFVVHAFRVGDNLTICGRKIFKDSKIKFKEDAEGACQKCLNRLSIERRIHPGWDL